VKLGLCLLFLIFNSKTSSSGLYDTEHLVLSVRVIIEYLVCFYDLIPLSIFQVPVPVNKAHDLDFIIVLCNSMHIGCESIEITATKQAKENLFVVKLKIGIPQFLWD
jgi:hypothetical protein